MFLDVRSLSLEAIIERLEDGQIGHDDLFDLGTMLWQALFASPEIERRYLACQTEAGSTKGIRIKLNIESPDLMVLPWEYLYDPESQTFPALSPRTQLTFVDVLQRAAASGVAQFVIATHSPILLSATDSTIYSFDVSPVSAVRYEETDQYRVYKEFLTAR